MTVIRVTTDLDGVVLTCLRNAEVAGSALRAGWTVPRPCPAVACPEGWVPLVELRAAVERMVRCPHSALLPCILQMAKYGMVETTQPWEKGRFCVRLPRGGTP